MGGFFATAGGKASSHFAIWHGSPVLEALEPTTPVEAALGRCVPNPFARSCELFFELRRPEAVRFDVFDLAGRRVKALMVESLRAGRHSVTWDGTDDSGQRVPAGVYLYRMRAGSFVSTRRLVLVP